MEISAASFDLTDGANVLRILCGLFLIPHLVVKFKNQDFVKGFMAKAGLNPPGTWLYVSVTRPVGRLSVIACRADPKSISIGVPSSRR